MYAIVEIAGTQFRVQKGSKIKVPKLKTAVGETPTFTDVLLISKDRETVLGSPTIAGAAVQTTVVGHGRGKKIVVFKMKRRKKYRRKSGHRQDFTELLVNDIALDSDRISEKTETKETEELVPETSDALKAET